MRIHRWHWTEFWCGIFFTLGLLVIGWVGQPTYFPRTIYITNNSVPLDAPAPEDK